MKPTLARKLGFQLRQEGCEACTLDPGNGTTFPRGPRELQASAWPCPSGPDLGRVLLHGFSPSFPDIHCPRDNPEAYPGILPPSTPQLPTFVLLAHWAAFSFPNI